MRISTGLWNNLLSLGGLFLSAVALLLMLTYALFSVVSPSPNPYVDIIGYLILPGLFIIGLLTVPAGMLLKTRRLRRDPTRRNLFRFPELDLNNPRHRRAMAGFAALSSRR